MVPSLVNATMPLFSRFRVLKMPWLSMVRESIISACSGPLKFVPARISMVRSLSPLTENPLLVPLQVTVSPELGGAGWQSARVLRGIKALLNSRVTDKAVLALEQARSFLDLNAIV